MIPQQQHPSSRETASLVVHLRTAQERLRQASEAVTRQAAVWCEETTICPDPYQQALGTVLAVVELAHELHAACQHLTRQVSSASSVCDFYGEHGNTQVVFVLAQAKLRWVEVCANEAMSSLLAGLFPCQILPLIPLPQRKQNIPARLERLAEACEDAMDGLARVADRVHCLLHLEHRDARESTHEEHPQAAAHEQEEAPHP